MSVVRLASLDDQLRTHLAGYSAESFSQIRRDFEENGLVVIPQVLPESIKQLIADEATLLVDTRSVRRDLQLKETSFSYRKMRNVAADEIRAHDGWIRAVYHSMAWRETLSWVVGEPVRTCPYPPEEYIINRLESTGDTHGWHWDDYSLAVLFVVECPPLELGGFVQTVAGTSWDKADPRVFQTLVEHPIRSHFLNPGDIYVLRSDTTLHQVHPLRGGRRTIVNMTFAADRDLEREISHETMEELFRVESPK
jgi:hypothetical protein